MDICTNCNGKGYNTVFVGAGGYTDLGPREYIETTPLGIQKISCRKCQKEDINNKKKRIQLEKLHFQVIPYDKLRRDSPIVIHIPMRDDWVDYNRQMYSKGTPLYWDLDECYECQLISIKHLESIINWRDTTNEKEDIDLSE